MRLNHLSISLLAAVISVGSVSSRLLAQEPSAPPQSGATQPPDSQDTIKVNTNEVLLDVVVRDRHGRPVRDLRPEEIEVLEDGVKQKINSFQLVEGGLAAPASTNRKTGVPEGYTPLDPARPVHLISLVFDNLHVEERRLAKQAAMHLLDTELNSNVLVAVFTIGNRLSVLQQFTNDRKLLKEAVERAVAQSNTEFESKSDQIKQQLEQYEQDANRAQQIASQVGRNNSSAGLKRAVIQAKIDEIILNALALSEMLEREQQGRSSLYALLALVKEQEKLTGRKTLIYFAEGLTVPPNLEELFQTTKSRANLANVSVYAVDARGLFTQNVTTAGRDLLSESVRATQSQQASRGAGPVTREQVMAGDTAERSLRSNVQGTLDDIAKNTGGFLIANTNDLRSGMERIASDVMGYYAITYAPTTRNYDGKFHAIGIKVMRPGVTVQARNGYLDLPPGRLQPVTAYEAPMIAALASTTLPRAFELHVATLRFEQESAGTEHDLIMEVPLSSFKFVADREKKLYHTHFSLLALVKNADGQVAKTFSQDFPLEGPLGKLEESKGRNVVFMRDFSLPPGRYTLEAIALDHDNNAMSAKRSVLMVPSSPHGVRMSSLSIIKRMDSAENSGDNHDPLRVNNSRIVPYVTEPLLQEGNGNLPLYLVIYPAREIGQSPKLQLDFLKDGTVIGSATPDLPAADNHGKIPYILTVPAKEFKPGRYEIRAIVRQGQSTAEEHAFFNVN